MSLLSIEGELQRRSLRSPQPLLMLRRDAFPRGGRWLIVERVIQRPFCHFLDECRERRRRQDAL
jgi:hypothetical protein